MNICIAKFDKKKMLIEQSILTKTDSEQEVFDARIKCTKVIKKVNDFSTKYEYKVEIVNGIIDKAVVFFEDTTANWRKENYVFAPAAVYNGNRFKSIKMNYPPTFRPEDNPTPDMDTTMSDVPKLPLEGDGNLTMTSSDFTTPCVAYFDEANKKGRFVFFEQKNKFGRYGVELKEKGDNFCMSFSSPCFREKRYFMCDAKNVSFDEPTTFSKGDIITFDYLEHNINCKDLAEFYLYFFNNRNSLIDNWEIIHTVPWGYACKLVEDKYNVYNWQKDNEFYTSNENQDSVHGQWQTGWVGGAMDTLYKFKLGNDLSKERSAKTFDFIFSKLQVSSGFLYGIYSKNKAYGDLFFDLDNAKIVMSRKNADALYFIAKQLIYLKSIDYKIPNAWYDGLKKLADAFCRMVDKYGQVGQFINIEAETIYAGSTASAGVVSGGLALCSEFYNDKKYLDYAIKTADYFYKNYIAKGYTNGGPGEILQTPDAESAFGLLESYVTLFEITKDKKWLCMAEETAHQCSSWVVSYDFEFEAHSQMYYRNAKTTGAVWANVQNKHAAPGICTHSGDTLFKLYKATKNIKYLELLKGISHSITQYISTPDNPMYGSFIFTKNMCKANKFKLKLRKRVAFLLKIEKNERLAKFFNKLRAKTILTIGAINERINMSDWEWDSNIGEIFLGSCWPEVSLLLTGAEVPSVYVETASNFVFTLDHILAEIVKIDGKTKLKITNPTKYSSTFSIAINNSKDFIYEELSANESKLIDIK